MSFPTSSELIPHRLGNGLFCYVEFRGVCHIFFSHAADGFFSKRISYDPFTNLHHPCIFVHSICDVLPSLTLICIYFFSFTCSLPHMYFLAWMCLRKVVLASPSNNCRAGLVLHPYDVRQLCWDALTIVLRTCRIALQCFIHSPFSFSLLCGSILLPFFLHFLRQNNNNF